MRWRVNRLRHAPRWLRMLGRVAAWTFWTGGSAAAADWSIAPALTLGMDFDTNRNLAVDARSSGGLSGALRVPMDRATERLDLSLVPQVDFQYFTDPTLSRADDFGLTGGMSWSSERANLAMSTRWTDQSLLTAEKFDTGIIDLGTRSIAIGESLSWSYAVTERTVSSLSVSHQTQDFVGTPVADLQNSAYTTLGFNQGFVQSSRLEFDLGASVGGFASPSQTGSTKSYSLDVGFKRQWTERLKITGDIGANELSYGPLVNHGLIFDLNVAYATAVGSLTLVAQRNAAPSGFGVLTERDAVQFSASRALSERINLGAAFDLYRNSSAVGAVTFDERTYADASVSVSYRYTETWTFTAHILADGARTQGIAGDTQGFNFGVQALWAPLVRSISR